MKNLLVILAVLALSEPTVVHAQKKGSPMYTAALGIAPYTYRKSFPKGVAATLDTVKRMGFTEIEGGGGRDMSPEEFKKLCDERGIRIPGTGASYEELVKGPSAVAERAKKLGATYVMCAWIPHDNNKFTPENAKKAADDFNKIGKVLHENGLRFCYHAHGYEFQPYEQGTLLDYLFDHTDADYVSFEMDVFWIQFGGGDPVALMKKYGSRWKLMHLKDMKKGTKKDLTGQTSGENNVVLGTGELDMPGIISEANKIGIRHFFIEDESSFPTRQLQESIAYLKSLKN